MGSELQDGSYLLTGQSVEHANDLVNRQPVFEILKDRGDGNTSASKHPRPADFAGNAFNRFAL